MKTNKTRSICVYTCTIYTCMHHLYYQIPPKCKICLVGLPSVLYERPDQNEISVLNQLFLLFFRFFSVVFMCFSCTFHEKCSFSYKKFHFSWKLTKPAQCVYTCIIYTYMQHMHHQITPKYKIYLVGLPSVLYERPSQNERSVLNQWFLLLFRCFSVLIMYF